MMTIKDTAARARLLRVRALDGGARLGLTLAITGDGQEQKEQLCVLTARLSHTPVPGELDEATLSHLRHEDALCAALDKALRSLAFGAGSRAGLIRKLCAKGVSATVAGEAADELIRRGYVEERESAVRDAERGMEKLWGDKRILADLRAKGYGEDALREAHARVLREDGAARCRRLIEKRYAAMLTRGESPQRLITALMRYGYTTAQIRHALRALTDEDEKG